MPPPTSSMSGKSRPSMMGGKVRTEGGKTAFGGNRGIAGKRHRKILKENIKCITKGDIRRLARRGGVKRISSDIYDSVRSAMKRHLEEILRDCCALVDHQKRKTCTVTDVIFALRRIGRPIYGFDKDTYTEKKGRR